jgi:hypothetical protein
VSTRTIVERLLLCGLAVALVAEVRGSGTDERDRYKLDLEGTLAFVDPSSGNEVSPASSPNLSYQVLFIRPGISTEWNRSASLTRGTTKFRIPELQCRSSHDPDRIAYTVKVVKFEIDPVTLAEQTSYMAFHVPPSFSQQQPLSSPDGRVPSITLELVPMDPTTSTAGDRSLILKVDCSEQDIILSR